MYSVCITNIFYQILSFNVKDVELKEVQFMRMLIFCESMYIAKFQIHTFLNNLSHQNRRYSLQHHRKSKLWLCRTFDLYI